jgi:DNA-binding transcriptional MocR family regulator
MDVLLYEQLAGRLIDHIQEGVYPVGSRLPSVRALAKSEQVSIATVTSAYSVLEERGWAEPKPKSGYFVKRAAIESLNMPKRSRAKTSPRAVTVAELAMAVQRGAAASKGVVFSAAVPDLDFPISEVVKRNFTRLSRYQSSFGNGYDIPEGLLELRKQIARRAVDAGLHISPDALITTMGAQNAISHALRALTTAGDIVAVESPCYFGVLQMIEGFGLKAIEIPTDPVTGMSVDALTLALQRWPIKAILTIPAFSNPLGCIIPMEKKRILIQLAQRYDIPIIEDDIYGDLQFEGRRSKALKSIDPDGRVLWCSSVSKTMDPHLRVGWIAPGRYYNEVLQQKFVSEISSPSLPQLVTAEIMKKGLYDRHLRHARVSYHLRYMRLLELAREYFPHSMRVSSAKGGLVAWFEMPRSVDATELYYICREEDIHLAPGELFSVSGLYQNCFRLSFSNAWTPDREQALAFIGRMLNKMV